MSGKGMDTDAAFRLVTEARSLVELISGDWQTVDDQVDLMDWSGPDADRWRADWRETNAQVPAGTSGVAPFWVSLRLIEDAAADLQRNAEEQVRTSGN